MGPCPECSLRSNPVAHVLRNAPVTTRLVGSAAWARGGGLEPPTSRIRILRAASCATPEWANRQFSRPGPGRGRSGSRSGPTAVHRSDLAYRRAHPTRGRPHYDRPAMATERAVIVGGGIIGTMHALEACRRGWEVLHLEADAGPRSGTSGWSGSVVGPVARSWTWPSGPASGGRNSPPTSPTSGSVLTAPSPWQKAPQSSR
jgi:FAD dependent oxidoreductase